MDARCIGVACEQLQILPGIAVDERLNSEPKPALVAYPSAAQSESGLIGDLLDPAPQAADVPAPTPA